MSSKDETKSKSVFQSQSRCAMYELQSISRNNISLQWPLKFESCSDLSIIVA